MIAQFLATTKKYGKFNALSATSFVLKRNETVALLGLNGSGKSTSLRLLSGLMKPSSGQVLVDGKPPQEKKDCLAYLSDRPCFPAWMKINDVSAFMAAFYQKFDPTRFVQLCNDLDVPTTRLDEQSKGQQQRLRLAAHMARTADLYIFDEPLSGIDVLSRRLIVDKIRDCTPWQSCVVIATHEIKEIDTLFDRALILKKGDLVADVERADLPANVSLADHFFNLHQGSENGSF